MIKNIPLNYSFRNLFVRKTTTVFTILGLALVVFVFCTIVMLNRGLEKTVVATGENDNLIVTRRGSGSRCRTEYKLLKVEQHLRVSECCCALPTK